MSIKPNDTCMNANSEERCHGELHLNFSEMGTRLVRCDFHWRKRQKVEVAIRELESPIPAPWFDPGEAGETWGDEGLE